MIKKFTLLIPLSLLFSSLFITQPALAQSDLFGIDYSSGNPFSSGYDASATEGDIGEGLGQYLTVASQCANFPAHGAVVCRRLMNDFILARAADFKPSEEPPKVAELIDIATLTTSGSSNIEAEAGNAVQRRQDEEEFFNPYAP